MAIKIITDSASDITLKEMSEKNVELVPLTVQCGEDIYVDDKTIPMEMFWKMLLDGLSVKTSLPSPNEFLKVFEAAKQTGDEVICILVSSKLSGTYQSAMLAKEICDYDKIYIIDSKTAAAAEKLQVFEACSMRDKGTCAKEIAAHAEQFKERVRLIACLDTLEYLTKGGRLSATAANIGTFLKLKPIVSVEKSGEIKVVKKSRGVNRAMCDMTDLILSSDISKEQTPIPLYAYNSDNCQAFIDKLNQSSLSCMLEAPEGIGATIGTYIGPGAYGIAYVEK